MSYSVADRANMLIEALPYIQNYSGKTIVIKYGGNAMVSEALRRSVISDIVLLSLVGIRVVVVHGGGPEISDIMEKVGKKPVFINGLRYTDDETMHLVQMVLCGQVNKDLVGLINGMGGRALGLCGIDGQMLKARALSPEYGRVGDITGIDPRPVTDALENGYLPVVATVAQGVDGPASYNINADTAAAKIAVAVGAEKLILLTDVPGLFRDPEDESTFLRVVPVSTVPGLIKDGCIRDGMIPKVECCVEAVRSGVRRSHIIDGRAPHSILIEIFSDEGIGTMIL